MKLETQGPVTIVRMEAGKANAIGPAFLARLQQLLDELGGRPPGPVVLTGYERFFSGGLDLPALSALDRPAMDAFLGTFEGVALRLFTLPRPVVAAVNGHAIAGGCVLALQADHRVMVERGGRIGLNEVQLGLGLPAVVLETLRCQVPAASLRPIALEGRLFEPPEALAVGLVDELAADPLTRAVEKARELGSLPAEAYAQVKTALRANVAGLARRLGAQERVRWLDGWFSDEGRARVSVAVARLQRT